MISEESFYGVIEDRAAQVGALAFPLVLWPMGGFFLAKSTDKITPEQGAMIGLLFGIGHAYLAKKRVEEEPEGLAVFTESTAEEDVLALPSNVVKLDDYRGACSCDLAGPEEATPAPGLPKTLVYLGVAAGLLYGAYKLSPRRDTTGLFIDKLAREEW